MANEHYTAKETLGQFQQTVRQLLELDAGAHANDPDRPMHEFNAMLDDASRKPIESDAHLRVLRAGIDYLSTTEPGALGGSLDTMVDTALGEAIADAPCALQEALLALARHRLRGHSISPPNA